MYQRTTAQLLAEPTVLWLVFAPLATDVSEEYLRLAIEAAKERASSRAELDDPASCMHVVATARPKEHALTQRILAMFQEEGLIERTWLFRHGSEKGREEGVQAIRSVLVSLLTARGLTLPAAQHQRMNDMHDIDTLRVSTERATTAKTANAVFSTWSSKPARKRYVVSR